jgi:hypothetical protein
MIIDYIKLLLVVIRLTCLMHVIYARHAYMLPTLHPKKNQATNINTAYVPLLSDIRAR